MSTLSDFAILVVAASLLLMSTTTTTSAFMMIPINSQPRTFTTTRANSRLFMAGGFGGGGDSSSKKKKPEKKLKPKSQWDRYGSLKGETAFRVGVKVVDEWLDVGRVKSKENANTEIAVARQRAIIADHARRLFPLAVSPKERVEWGYLPEDSDESSSNWIVVDKSVVDSAPEGIEKQIGFEGRPDPASGFYCYYSEGRLVSSDDVSLLSKKRQ